MQESEHPVLRSETQACLSGWSEIVEAAFVARAQALPCLGAHLVTSKRRWLKLCKALKLYIPRMDTSGQELLTSNIAVADSADELTGGLAESLSTTGRQCPKQALHLHAPTETI